MAETRQALLDKLAQARQELAESQIRVTELQDLLTIDQATSRAMFDSEKHEHAFGDPIEQSEDRFQSLAEEIKDCIIYRLDTDGHIISWNIGADQLTGYRNDEIIGQHYSRLFTPADQQNDKPQRLLSAAGKQGYIEGEGWHVRKGGSHFWANMGVTALRNPDGSLYGFANITRDLTQREQADEHIRKLHRTLGVLSDINQAIARIRHLPTLFEKACGIAVERGAFRMAWIGQIDLTAGHVTPVAQAGVSDGYVEKLIMDLSADSPIQNPFTNSLRTGLRWLCNDLENDPQMLPWRDDMLRLGYGASVALPLKIAGKVRGLFNLYTEEIDFFDVEELRLLDEMAGDISLAMEIVEQDEQRSKAEEEVKRYVQRMDILHQIDTGIIKASSIQEIVEIALNHIQQLIPCQRVSAMLVDQTQNEALVYELDLSHLSTIGTSIKIFAPSSGLDEHDTDHIIIINDLRLIQELTPTQKQLLKEGQVTFLSAPLNFQGHPIGLLTLASDIPSFFTAEHREIVAEISNQLSIAIHQMHLDETLARHTVELEQHVKTVEDMHQFLHATLDAFPANTAVLDRDGTIININAPWIRFADENNAGLATHYLGANYLTVCDSAIGSMSEEAAPVAAGIRAVIAGQQDNFHLEYTCNSSTEKRWFMMNATPFSELAPRRVVVSHININERKQAEEALQVAHDTLERRVLERTAELTDAKERVEAILNNSTDGLLLLHTDLKIQQTNASFNRLMGCEPDDYFGKSLVTLFHEADVERVIKLIEVGAPEQGAQSIEVHVNRKDGTGFDAELSIGHIKDKGTVCTIRDITERKATERQLRYLASLQESVVDAVIVTDPEFHIQTWNLGAERIYGWKAEDVIGKLAPELLQIRHPVAQDQGSARQTFNEQGFLQRETIQRRKDDTDIYILGSATLLTDKNGVSVGVISVNRDITERKTQERQLRYHANLQENVSDAVIVTDIEFRIQSWNRAAQRIYGWVSDEVVGKQTAEILRTQFPHSGDLENSRQHLREQGWWQGEVIQHHKDGTPRHILGSVTLVKDEHGLPFGIVSVNRDITERNEAHEALQKSAAEINDLYNNAPCGYHSIDANGLITQINDTELNWLGYTNSEVVNKLKVTTLLTSESTLRFQQSFPLFKKRGWINELALDFIRKDGSILHTLLNATAIYGEDGQYLKSRSILFDITELKRSERTLIESEARYRLLAENISDVIAKTSPDGIRTFITPSCYPLLGYTPDELIGRLSVDIIHPEDRPGALGAVMQAVSEGKTSFPFIQRFRHKAGNDVWVEVTNNIIYDQDSGKPLEIIGVLRDITERKKAEATLQIKIEEERQFQANLKTLHEIIIELTGIEQLGTFYKRAVELGRERLGFERLAMFLYDEQDGNAIGTFGTDIQGNVVDERDVRFKPDPNGIMRRSFERIERFYFNEQATLFYDELPVGNGWNVAAVLWNGTRGLGWLVADNLLSHAPASKSLLDLIGLYGLSIGTLLAQKQTQLALRESEALYRLLAENINDLVMRSTLTSECLYISPSVQVILGYTPEELLGKQTFDFVHPDDQTTISDAYASALERNNLIMPHRYRAKHKDGHYVWLETVGKPLLSEESNEISGVITSSRDVTDRKHAEEALRDSEEKFRLLLDAAPIATVISDETGHVALINVQAETMFGFDRTELIGQSVDVLVPDYARSGHADKRVTYVEAPRVRQMGEGLDLLARRKDGTEFSVEIELSYVQTTMGLLVMSFIVDITERKQNAAILEQQRLFLRSVIDSSPSMIIVKDYDSRFVLVNRRVAEIYNTTVDNLIGKRDSDFDLGHGEADFFVQKDRQAMENGQPIFIPEETVFGRYYQTNKIPLKNQAGNYDRLLVVSSDITERKQSEEALKENEQKYRSLVETMRGGLVIFDLEGKITFINDRFCEILGYSPAEVIGTRATEYVDPSNLSTLISHLEKRRQLQSTTYELLFRHKNGAPVYLLVSGSPLFGKNGDYKGSFAVTTDISAQKRAEDVLRQALEKEKELSELKTRFVSMASHEFRTPLATMLTLTETLSAYRHKMADDQIELRLEKIRIQIDHLKNIMDDVLELARFQARRTAFNPVKTNLDSLCRSILDEFQSRPDIKHQVQYFYDAVLEEAQVDKKLLRQIISNLVSNAIKYSPTDQVVTVRLEVKGDSFVITVRDGGIGIPESDLKYLFEPFHRGDNVGAISGTGLGLVITKESVELHGGTISVDSQLGVGTTFTVTIPLIR